MYAPFPAEMHPALQSSLRARGIESMYSHQAESFVAARGGQNLVITTGRRAESRLRTCRLSCNRCWTIPRPVLSLFPTQALTQDQLRGVLGFIDGVVATGKGTPIQAGVYDGDTPPAERTRIRDKANLILTNPDMLHSALLPNHGRRGFSHMFRNVRFIVIDELHTYRGAFGAHFANLMRRLRRLCRHYGSDPNLV